MTDQVTQGDASVKPIAASNAPDLNANMARLANDFMDQGIQDCNKSQLAPTSGTDKFVLTTLRGAENVPAGLGHALVEDVVHWDDTLKMVGTSAVVGAALKTILPDTGIAGKVVGLGIGAYFMYQASAPVTEAYSKGMNAKTMDDIDKAGTELGDATGAFVVNSGVAALGYRLGSGAMGDVLKTKAFDKFAVAKENLWNQSASEARPNLDVLEPANSRGLAARTRIVGDRATLLDSAKPAPKEAIVKGAVDQNAPMDVTIFAQTKGSDFMMKRELARIGAKTQAPLTTAEVADRYGTVPESYAAIEKFAKANGLAIADHNPASGRIQLTGTTGQMMSAFDVKLQEYQHQSGVTFRGRTGTVSVSSDLAPHVKAVLGLDNRPAFKTNYVKGAPLAAPAAGDAATAVGGVAPRAGATPAAGDGARALQVEEIMKGYNADPKLDGKGMTTGFLSLGGIVDEGWEANLTAKGIDPKTVEFRNAGSSEPTSDPQGANGENRLDFYMHKYGLPKATTAMVMAENNDTGMPTGIDRITFPKDGESQITHASVSWGQFEDGWTAQSRALMEDAGKRAALKGVTITVASGDNGAGDGSPSRKQQVDIPAGLEHFTGVGGTRLVLNSDGTWKSEVGWDGMGASGGGRSMFTLRPIWQKLLNLPANLNGSKFDGRGVPDIASNGDPRSGMITPGPGGDEAIGGTSLSAPTDAVKAAKISQATGRPTGPWNPELYDMAAKNPGVFHDIVKGRNTDGGIAGYPATPGYDLETGLGSIDVGKYIEARNKMLNQSVVAKSAAQIPGYIARTQQVTPLWGTPYYGSPFNNANDKPAEDTNK